MTWLTQERCNGCGSKIKDASQTHCLNCKADWSVVGKWSEFKEWQETRKKGCLRYVLSRALVFGLMAIGMHARSIWNGSYEWLAFSVTYLIMLLTGLVACYLMWRSIEKEFLAELAKQQSVSLHADHDSVSTPSRGA